MALAKETEQADGVVTSYHRVLFVQNTPNSHVSVAVASLVSGDVRERERSGDVERAYSHVATYETEETDEMTTAEAYGWLKTLPDFAGATDC